MGFGQGGLHQPDRLLWGDNLEALASISDQSVDVTYIDPPFGAGGVRRGSGQQTAYEDKLDDPERFVAWLTPRLVHCRRVLKEQGSLFVHLDYRSVHYIKVALDALFGQNRFVNEIIWCYSVGGKGTRHFGRKHDTILWYSKTRGYAFYPESIRVPRKPNSHMRRVKDANGEVFQEKTDRKSGKVYRYPVDGGKLPEDWWTDIETLNRGDRERSGWPTQKPMRLLDRLIQATTQPGDMCSDWFCGSGTTAVVAQKLGRRFVASDRAASAILCAAERLDSQGQILASEGTPPPDIVVRAVETTHDPARRESDVQVS